MAETVCLREKKNGGQAAAPRKKWHRLAFDWFAPRGFAPYAIPPARRAAKSSLLGLPARARGSSRDASHKRAYHHSNHHKSKENTNIKQSVGELWEMNENWSRIAIARISSYVA